MIISGYASLAHLHHTSDWYVCLCLCTFKSLNSVSDGVLRGVVWWGMLCEALSAQKNKIILNLLDFIIFYHEKEWRVGFWSSVSSTDFHQSSNLIDFSFLTKLCSFEFVGILLLLAVLCSVKYWCKMQDVLCLASAIIMLICMQFE